MLQFWEEILVVNISANLFELISKLRNFDPYKFAGVYTLIV